ncbi:diguanylate cyclase [Actinoplanes sp. NPDC051851]|uniref:diguanylate cyclase n=1 Tax=Actinoplanes sp. NPDC051851 TaxID=3154753 RepID=UPI00342C3903
MSDVLYDGARTRVVRDGEVVRKQPFGADAPKRLSNELAMLRRLAGVHGVPQLAVDQEAGALRLLGADGVPLAEQAKPWDVAALLELGDGLARILAAVHRRGVVHRDVSPANVLIPAAGLGGGGIGGGESGGVPSGGESGGGPTLIDFDLAGVPGAEFDMLSGTLPYLAPEQSGRTGRAVDHRADLYALGATLYELATGEPPFGRDREPLHLVHDHLAKQPESPSRIDPRIPGQLSAILLRLLSKEPEQRYQSGEGLAYDLERLKSGNTGFLLGERDFPIRLTPPVRLVGREEPVARLRALLNAGERGLALVSGPPGVGKTAVIEQMRPVVTAAGGHFVTGKFDQFRRDQGADAVRQAFTALGGQLLAESDFDADELRTALGVNAGLAAAVLPTFAALLGVPPEEVDDPWHATARIRQMGRDILRTVASPARPLVIVVDDLQWGGPAASGWLDDILEHPDLPGVLAIGAYREAEVDESHPLAAVVSRLQRDAGNTAYIRLENLPAAEMSELLAEMLRMSVVETEGLAAELAVRTGGNPFDTVELVNALRGEGRLVPEGDRWIWDAYELRRFVGSTDVADLLDARIEALPEATRELLEIMACLGGEVGRELLCAAAGMPDVDVALAPAVEDGLVTAEGFRHDRVQQSAYRRIGPERHARLAHEVAVRLAGTPGCELAAATQYLVCLDLITEPDDRHAVGLLLREAGAIARSYTNHAAAGTFLAAAVALLGTGDPDRRETLAAWHTALCVLGRFDEADEVYAEIDKPGADPVLVAAVAAEQVVSLVNRGQMLAALDLGRAKLAALGVDVPEDPGAAVAAGFAGFHAWLADGDAESDLRRPTITDQRLLVTARLIDRLGPAAFYADKTTMAWLVMLAVDLWWRHGTAAELVGAAAFISFITAAQGDFRSGYEANRRLIAVGAARGWEPAVSHARYLHALAGLTYFEPVEHGLRTAHEARDGLLRGGDVTGAVSTAFASVPQILDCADVDTYAAEVGTVRAMAERIGYGVIIQAAAIHGQLVSVLRGEADPGDLAPPPGLAENPPLHCWFETVRAIAAAVFLDDRALARSGAAAVALTPAVPGTYVVPQAHLMGALGAAVRLRESGSDVRARALADLTECRDFLAARAADQVRNYGHLHRFAEAVHAWATGDHLTAARAFNIALTDVAGVDRPWHAALIAEHAARFHLEQGMEHTGRQLLGTALRAYAAWGAHGKTVRLAREYPFLAEGRVDTSHSVNLSIEAIDVVGMLEAARVLSSETDLDSLRTTVERVLGAMTGATSVRLLIADPEAGGWTLPTAAGLPSQALAEVVPMSAVHYAERLGEPMLVDDAARDDRVARDPYLTGKEHCSLLVVPVHGAMLVLENTLIRRAFTTARLNAVTMLAGQLSVSLDNARLYASLERKVAERTAELAVANQRLELLTVTDPLTELPNRRHLTDTLDQEWGRAQRSGEPIGLAMIDIDEFKKYNDHYGHQGGDDCLRLVAGALRTGVRSTDLVARYGGEEFCIVMPGAAPANALVMAERVCRSVADLREPHEASAIGIVTISIGVASAVPFPGAVPDQLIKLADEALYEAKRMGRNRAMGHESDV